LTIGGLGSYYLARRTLEPLEKAHEQQKRFTADASHELRTPLAAMQTEIEVALRDKKLTKDQSVELLESIQEELQDMTGLSEKLLMLARQDSSDSNIKLKTVSFNVALKPALKKVKPLAKRKSISITKKIEDKKVMAERNQLTELLVVLLENAIKYSQDGQKIRIKGETVGEKRYKVSVIDKGVGVDEQDQARIFDRFYRADNSRSAQNTGGHGLGLSIAKAIADNHHSEIKIDSEPDKGSTFSFELNLA
jgi:signal transduction histidine kinase